MTKVMVFGTFDLIHPGHVHMMEEAKTYGDYLIVVVSRDHITTEVKGKAPMYNENSRLESVKQLNIADKVILGNAGKDRYATIHEEDPDIIALGYDQVAFVDELEKNIKSTIKIVRLKPFKPDEFKSSKLKEKIKKDK